MGHALLQFLCPVTGKLEGVLIEAIQGNACPIISLSILLMFVPATVLTTAAKIVSDKFVFESTC